MSTFTEIFNKNDHVLSFEFFPPKKEEKLDATKELMSSLSTLQPHFMTVTYGAGGGTRSFTRDLVSYIHNSLEIPAVSHLTCVDHSSKDIEDVIKDLESSGIRHILALRGDPPQGEDTFTKHPDGFGSARELTEFIKILGNYSIATAGYPEVHQEAESREADLQYLKTKVDAGAEVIITQLFFDPELYLTYREEAEKLSIRVPILPGIMPISNVSQVERFTQMCGASIPKKLHEKLLKFADEKEAVLEIGTEHAIAQIERLLAEGAPGLHLYTLNKQKQVSTIVENVPLKKAQ